MSDVEIVIQEIPSPVEVIVSQTGAPGTPGLNGAAGILLTESGSLAVPRPIVGSIPITNVALLRVFIEGSVAAVVNPTIANGTTTHELWLYGCNDVKTVTLSSGGNLKLTSTWVGKRDSILRLVWDGASRWVEVSRNGI